MGALSGSLFAAPHLEANLGCSHLEVNLGLPLLKPIWVAPSGSQFGAPHLGANMGHPILQSIWGTPYGSQSWQNSRDWHVTVHCDHYATFVGMIIVQNSNLLYCHYATLVDISLGRHNTVLCGHHEPRTIWLFYVAIIPH